MLRRPVNSWCGDRTNKPDGSHCPRGLQDSTHVPVKQAFLSPLYLPQLPAQAWRAGCVDRPDGTHCPPGLPICWCKNKVNCRLPPQPTHVPSPPISFTLSSPGPTIPWRAGRVDKPDGSHCPPDGRLPDAAQGASHIRDVFGRMVRDAEWIGRVRGCVSYLMLPRAPPTVATCLVAW